MDTRFGDIAAAVDRTLPRTPRLVVIGSSSFLHPDSERTCVAVGRNLANICSLAVITGGRTGVGETVGRSVHRSRLNNDQEPQVYHLLPIGFSPLDYGKTLFCGRHMIERREVLGRVANLYLAIEGGPGTEYEATVALSKGATVIPVGRSGGYSGNLYGTMAVPRGLCARDWRTLGVDGVGQDELAEAVKTIVSAFLSEGV